MDGRTSGRPACSRSGRPPATGRARRQPSRVQLPDRGPDHRPARGRPARPEPAPARPPRRRQACGSRPRARAPARPAGRPWPRPCPGTPGWCATPRPAWRGCRTCWRRRRRETATWTRPRSRRPACTRCRSLVTVAGAGPAESRGCHRWRDVPAVCDDPRGTPHGAARGRGRVRHGLGRPMSGAASGERAGAAGRGMAGGRDVGERGTPHDAAPSVTSSGWPRRASTPATPSGRSVPRSTRTSVYGPDVTIGRDRPAGRAGRGRRGRPPARRAGRAAGGLRRAGRGRRADTDGGAGRCARRRPRSARGTRCCGSPAPLRELLGAERTLLNFLTHLSGDRHDHQGLGRRAWPGPGAWSATPARPRRACASWRSTRCAAAAGPTTGWGSGDAALIKDNHVAAAGGVARGDPGGPRGGPGPAAGGRVRHAGPGARGAGRRAPGSSCSTT